jgi:hypothetical protein
VEALKWLTLAVDKLGAGDILRRAIINLNHARAQATPQQKEEAERRAEEMRAKWKNMH